MPRLGKKERQAIIITIALALFMLLLATGFILVIEQQNEIEPPPSMFDKPAQKTPPSSGTGKVALPEIVSARIIIRKKQGGGLLGWDEMSVQTIPDLAFGACDSWEQQKLFGLGPRYKLEPNPCSSTGLPEGPKLPKKSWLLVMEEPTDPLESTLRSRSTYANIEHQEMMLFLASQLEWRRVRYHVIPAEAGYLEPMRAFQYRLYPNEKSCRRALAKLDSPVKFIAEAESNWIEQAIKDQEKRVASVCVPEGKATACETSRLVLRYLRRRQMSPTRPQKIDPPRCRPSSP